MISFHSDMESPKSPRKDDFPNYQAYLDAYDAYVIKLDQYHDWKQRQPERDRAIANFRQRFAELQAKAAKDDERDELIAYANEKALRIQQWRERVRRAIEDD